jgi:TolB-like protein
VRKVLATKNTDAESAEQLPISSESLAKSIAVLPFENLSRIRTTPISLKASKMRSDTSG